MWFKRRDREAEILARIERIEHHLSQQPAQLPDPSGMATMMKAMTEDYIARLETTQKLKQQRKAAAAEGGKKTQAARRAGHADCPMCRDPYHYPFTFEELAAHREHTGEKPPGAAPQQNGAKP